MIARSGLGGGVVGAALPSPSCFRADKLPTAAGRLPDRLRPVSVRFVTRPAEQPIPTQPQ